MKVPLIIVCSVISLGVGVAGGAGALLALGYHRDQPADNSAPPANGPQGMGPGGPQGPGGPPGMGPGGRPGGPPGMGPGGFGGGRGFQPNPKNSLANLVNKLSVLSAKPLQVQLDADQKTKAQEQLQGLENEEKLEDKDAMDKVKALQDLMTKEQREALEAAGYRWFGEAGGGFRPPPDMPNPFKEGDNREHLKALQDELAKTDSK
jgi:hypothetical protein